MGFIHHTTAAGTATGWMERSRPLPGSAVFASASPTATDLTCRLIRETKEFAVNIVGENRADAPCAAHPPSQLGAPRKSACAIC